MWAGAETQRGQIREAGLELATGELLATAIDGALLEGITMVLLLTSEDDFNALASTILRGNVEGPVYRLRPRLPGHGVVAPYTGGEALFGPELTRPAVIRRYAGGARIAARPGRDPLPAASEVLFLIRADGQLAPVTDHTTPASQDGDTAVFLDPKPQPPAAGAVHVPPQSAATATVLPQAPAAAAATPRAPLAAPTASPTTATSSPDTATSSPDTKTEQEGAR